MPNMCVLAWSGVYLDNNVIKMHSVNNSVKLVKKFTDLGAVESMTEPDDRHYTVKAHL
jgi:hypothetical protein